MTAVRTYRFLPLERVVHGLGAVERLSTELDRLGCERVTLLSSRSIARSPLLERVRPLVGGRLAAVFAEISQHTPSHQVTEAATIARAAQTDGIVSLGGGSVIDAAKAVAQCLEDGLLTGEQLFGRAPAGAAPGRSVPQVAIPTTLSAAEYAGGAGVTDEAGPFKESVGRASLVPRVVILDGELSRYTPSWLWAATGMRAVDHAVESITSPDAQRVTTVLAQEALRLLFAHLTEASAHPDDVALRQRCLEAAWLSYFGPGAVRMGLSHMLGRRIGAHFNVPHGPPRR